ncbi:MAG: GNAT family N-acetyltransferase [Litorimonas sp.]
MNIQIHNRLPTTEEFVALRSGVSWGTPTAIHAQQALKASIAGVTASVDGKTVGMARAVGDGVLNTYIQDVIVAEPYQKRGIGDQLVSTLIDSLSETNNPNCLIGLFAADGQDTFYTRFGFMARPQFGFGPGMHGTLSDLAKARGAA